MFALVLLIGKFDVIKFCWHTCVHGAPKGWVPVHPNMFEHSLVRPWPAEYTVSVNLKPVMLGQLRNVLLEKRREKYAFTLYESIRWYSVAQLACPVLCMRILLDIILFRLLF